MTTYTVQSPDGQTHQFEGPPGATPQQVLAVAQQQFGQSQQPAATAAPQQSPQDAAFAAGRDAGASEPAWQAGVSQAAQQGTLGLQNYVNAGARYVAQRLAGVKNADDFSTDLAYSRGKSQGEAEGHPIASTVGGTAGTFMGGAAAAKALPGAVTRFIAPVKGQAVGNVLKAAGAGAAVGAGQSLAQGDSLPQAGQDAALSAAGGVVGGKVASFALNRLQPAARQAMMTLADKIGETPATLQAAYNAYQNLTGKLPTMAELMGLKSQGQLRTLAAKNGTIADAAITAANMGNAPLHEQLAAAQTQSWPQTMSGLTQLRDAEMDEAMSYPHPQTGVPLRDEPVNDPNGILASPHVQLALQPNQAINARLNQPSPVLDRIMNNQATVGDVETVRKALRDMQNQFARPSPGSTHMKDPAIADEFGKAANQVENLATNQVPDYGAALANYRNHSRYAEGFEQGFSGKAVDDIDPTDKMRQTALRIVPHGATGATVGPNGEPLSSGLRGYAHGNALYTGQQALDAIAPSGVKPQEGANAGHLAQGAMAASSGGISAVYHAMRAIPGLHLPEKAQQVIAQQLFNPRTAQQGINNLQRAGIDADNLRKIAGIVGLTSAANVGRYTTNSE